MWGAATRWAPGWGSRAMHAPARRPTRFNAVILGAPGSGKGTVAGRISDKFDVVHVSSGDMLRSHIKKDTTIGREAKEYIERGELVPDETMLRLVLSDLYTIRNRNWLLDGFPRTRLQCEALLRQNRIHLAINLVVPFHVIIDRIKGRWVHVSSGRVYNTDFNAPRIPGKDDITGEDLEQRPDDRPEAVRVRLDTYASMINPVLDFFKEKNILEDFKGNSTDVIWPHVEQYLLNFINPK